MIRLSKINYFTGDPGSVAGAVNEIVRFLELDGCNPIFFTPDSKRLSKNSQTIGKSCVIVPRVEWTDIEDFQTKMADRGLMFRTSLMVLDFWHLSRAKIEEYKKHLSSIDFNIIIMAKEYIYSAGEDVGDFHVVVKYEGSSLLGFKSETTVTNKIDGWKSTLAELKKSYIRDKKIEGLLGDGEDS
jgi:hypothetical protein